MKEITLADAIKFIKQGKDLYVGYKDDYKPIETNLIGEPMFLIEDEYERPVWRTIHVFDLIDYQYYIKE